MIEIIGTQVRRKQTYGEGALAATLGADQDGNALVAMLCVHAQPMGYGRSDPDGTPRELFAADAWQTTEEVGHMVVSVPGREGTEEVAYGIVGWDGVRANVLLDVLLGGLVATHSLLLGMTDDGVHDLGGHGSPDRMKRKRILGSVRERAHLGLATQDVATKLIVLGQEGFGLEDGSLDFGHRL